MAVLWIQRIEFVDRSHIGGSPGGSVLVYITRNIKDDGRTTPHKQVRKDIALGLTRTWRRDRDHRPVTRIREHRTILKRTDEELVPAGHGKYRSLAVCQSLRIPLPSPRSRDIRCRWYQLSVPLAALLSSSMIRQYSRSRLSSPARFLLTTKVMCACPAREVLLMTTRPLRSSEKKAMPVSVARRFSYMALIELPR